MQFRPGAVQIGALRAAFGPKSRSDGLWGLLVAGFGSGWKKDAVSYRSRPNRGPVGRVPAEKLLLRLRCAFCLFCVVFVLRFVRFAFLRVCVLRCCGLRFVRLGRAFRRFAFAFCVLRFA